MKENMILMNKIIVFFCIFLLLSGSAASQQDERNDPEMFDSIKIETIKTDKFTMDYFRFGEGKETLVILPGLSVQSVMASADAVADAYRPLTDDFTIYLFDRRKELPDSYSVYEMAQDTAEAIQAAGLEHVNLFGASQGGMIAMIITLEHPELEKNSFSVQHPPVSQQSSIICLISGSGWLKKEMPRNYILHSVKPYIRRKYLNSRRHSWPNWLRP